ncbi:hypothetical protein CIB84_010424 [Bambusicola thoracicus]|uniref:Uncharacterized protein n=1 Tax=Bambusicola thoracicus TaxID=9083 RepID=A0A2P4SNX6_BAMTH|nr:hypothetical protein CIB84_010424 [Bambusicola thoracicus]
MSFLGFFILSLYSSSIHKPKSCFEVQDRC